MKDCLYEKQVTSPQGTTHYWTNDVRGGQAMVFLPGLTADHSLFETQTEAFHDKYRIIVSGGNRRVCGILAAGQKSLTPVIPGNVCCEQRIPDGTGGGTAPKGGISGAGRFCDACAETIRGISEGVMKNCLLIWKRKGSF